MVADTSLATLSIGIVFAVAGTQEATAGGFVAWFSSARTAEASREEQGVSGAVQGRVVDICGRPVIRATLGVTDSYPRVSVPLIGIYTDGRGRYTYEPLEPARYRITVRAAGYRPQTKSVRVRASRTSRLNFRVRLSRPRTCPPLLTG